MTIPALTQALRRDAIALLQAYQAGTWVLAPAEREFAEDLARGHWEAPYLRAALRELPPAVRSGRLIDILAPAAEAFDRTEIDQDTVLRLRILVAAGRPEPRGDSSGTGRLADAGPHQGPRRGPA